MRVASLSLVDALRYAFVLVPLVACEGFSGHEGPRGDMGQTGEAGVQGSPGAAGMRGLTGKAGADGAQGAEGAQGEAGAEGTPGAPGAAGARGAAGEAGIGLVSLYGDGVDGVVVLSADATLDGDMYYDTLTIAAGVTLHPNGFRVFVANTLTLADGAAIDRSGGTATSGTEAALPTGTLGGGGAGQAVNDCSATGGNVTNSLGGNAGSFEGTLYGLATPPVAAVGGPEIFDAVSSAVTGHTLDGHAVMGGAGGSSCALTPGNGGGGGVVVIAARVVTLSGASATISANGGNAVGTPATGSGIVGGGGGVVVVVSSVPTPTGLTLSVLGGTSVGTTTTAGTAGAAYWLN